MRNKYLLRVIGLSLITFISICFTIGYIILSEITLFENLELFLMPLVSIVILLINIITPRYKVQLKDEKDTGFSIVSIIMIAVFTIMQVIIVLQNSGFNINVWKLAIICFGFLVSLMGNYYPKLKQNDLFAIYNSWTVSNKKVWRKTHRFTGYLWVMGGLSIIFTAFLNNSINLWISLGILGLLLITPTIFSMIYYKYRVKKYND